jgi:hypothetical protein
MVRINLLAGLLWICLLTRAVSAQDGPGSQAIASQEQDATLAEQFSRGLFTPTTAAKLSLGLLYAQTAVMVPEWGSGRDGLARRAEWLTAGYLTRYTTEFATSKLLGTDTSYQRCRCKGFPGRAAHALHSEFVERKADGSPTFAIARLTGIYASAAITAPMLPSGYGVKDVNNRAMAAVAIDEGFNMLQEFWPEIKRTLLFRKRPQP